MTLNDLLAEREIYRNLVRFAQAMDNRDWQQFNHLTIDNITADLGVGLKIGRHEMVGTIRRYLDGCGVTQHLLGNVLIDIDGDQASSQAYVCDMHLGKGEKSQLTFHTLGLYQDKWQKINDQWLMTQRIKDNRATVGSMEVFNG